MRPHPPLEACGGGALLLREGRLHAQAGAEAAGG